MLTKLFIVLSLLTIGILPALAQTKSVLQFSSKVHDFGKIEQQDSLAHTFAFTNTGKAVFKISKIVNDCSCASINYPKENIASGESSYITVSYLPYKWGKFDKKFDIYNRQGVLETSLGLKGLIIPKQKIADQFKHKKGSLRLKKKYLNFGNINTKTPVSKKFEIYNPNEYDISFTGEMTVPQHIKILFDSTHIIKAHDVATIFVTYDSKSKNDFGYLQDEVSMMVSDTLHPELKLTIVATVEEYFPAMVEEQLAEMPKVRFNKTFIDFGNKSESDTLIATFTISNAGKTPLDIRKLESTPNCTILNPAYQLRQILPNESLNLRVFFQSSRKRGKQYGRVTLFSNDPKKSSKALQLSANIKTR
jgi:hypothetical protein